MQTRKRAKTITFTKKKKEKTEEPETIVAAPEQKVEKSEAPKAETPAKEVVSSSENTESTEEIDPTPLVIEDGKDESADKEITDPSVATAKDDFLTDTSPSLSAELPKEESPKEVSTDTETKPADDMTLSDNLSSVPEGEAPSLSAEEDTKPSADEPSLSATPEVASETNAIAEPAAPESDSSTSPKSAFSLQGGDDDGSGGGDGKKKFGLYFFVVALLSFILGLAAMAAVTYFGLVNISLPKQLSVDLKQIPGLPAEPTVAPTKAPEPTATPTPEPVDLAEYTIVILNGSGISGRAGGAQSSLTTAGFTVSSIGNAQTTDYTTTQITVKQSVPEEYVTQLVTELEKLYTLEKPSRIPDDSSQTSDVVVTLGSQDAK